MPGNSNNVILVGHSWGGHAVQNFLQKHKNPDFYGWKIIGGALLGSSIQRNLVTILKDGTS